MAVPTYQVLLVSDDGLTTKDVTSYVRSVSISRGRSRELDRFEAGSFGVVLDNRNRYFDPQYTDSTTRTNLVKNPIPSTSAAVSPQESWTVINRGTGGAGTTTLTVDGAFDTVTTAASGVVYTFGLNGGTTAARIPVTAGVTYSISFYATSSVSDTRRLGATFYNSAGTSIGDVAVGVAQTMLPGVEMRFTGTYTAPANAVSMRIYGGNTTGSIIRPVGSTMYWRNALVEETSTVGTYFSGNTTDTNYQIYSWTGTAEASTSTLLEYATPFYGYITPKRAIQIWSAGIKQFDGNIQDWNLSYDISGDSIAIANGADQFAYLAQQSLTGGLQTSELSGARLDAIVADPNITWPFGGVYTLFDTGRRTLQADTIPAGANALEYMQLVERTEGGYFYVSSGGDLTFKESGSANVSLINFTDSGVAGAYNIPYQGIDIIYGSELLYNQITLSRLSGGTTTVTKPISINAYGAASYTDADLLYNTDSDTTNQALLLAAKYATPEYRFDSVTVSLTSLTASKQANLLILDLTDIVKMIYTPNNVGSAISKYVRIIGIDHTMNVDDHLVTYHFASLENEQLILDNSIFGLLDYNVLGF